ncbi:MAG: ABC transporter ATP-binding protein [Sandaracinaceae bacterium]|nr:ABC transporter ATP-binding protein [Sandaracinaceae bacterium]
MQVQIRDVAKTYDGHEVLKGVTLDLYRGQTNVIIGASGSGKTVFLRQLIRLEQPDRGQILVDGEDIVPLGDVELVRVRRKFGMVFQMSALFDSMNVYDNVAFMLREHTKLSSKEIREKVMERLSALGVEHAAQKQTSELSGGMRKRVAVARALVMEPEILIYDEPTTGLDPITSRTVDDLIEGMRSKFGVTSVVISHDMASVFRIAHRINYLYKGSIDASGTPTEILESKSPRVHEFLEASGVSADLMKSGADSTT